VPLYSPEVNAVEYNEDGGVESPLFIGWAAQVGIGI
jgi:hypothetical protein